MSCPPFLSPLLVNTRRRFKAAYSPARDESSLFFILPAERCRKNPTCCSKNPAFGSDAAPADTYSLLQLWCNKLSTCVDEVETMLSSACNKEQPNNSYGDMDYTRAPYPFGEDSIGESGGEKKDTGFTTEHARKSISGAVFSVRSIELLQEASVRIASLWRGEELACDVKDAREIRGDIGDTIFMTPHDGGIWTEVVPPVITTSVGELDYMMEHDGIFGGLYACLGGNAMDTEGAITIKAHHEAREIVIRTISLADGRSWMRKERKKRERLQQELMTMEMPVATKMQKGRIGRRVERLRPSSTKR